MELTQAVQDLLVQTAKALKGRARPFVYGPNGSSPASVASDGVGNSMHHLGVAGPVSSSGLASQPVKLDVARAVGFAGEGVRKTWRS